MKRVFSFIILCKRQERKKKSDSRPIKACLDHETCKKLAAHPVIIKSHFCYAKYSMRAHLIGCTLKTLKTLARSEFNSNKPPMSHDINKVETFSRLGNDGCAIKNRFCC